LIAVLASEEYKAPYVAIVKDGTAIIMKQINVAIHIPGKKTVGSNLAIKNNFWLDGCCFSYRCTFI